MRAVAATGYDGYLSLEIFNDQFRGGSAKAISVDGHRSLVYLMDQVRREEPALAVAAPAMPDRIAVEGVEFVEFAADRKGAEQLRCCCSCARLLARPAGTSQRIVTLYRQGEINLVINTERQGLPILPTSSTATSAYAIGLKVDDAAATVARASRLGPRSSSSRSDRGNCPFPAIRGVGGGVIYFLDDKSDLAKVWDIEFTHGHCGKSGRRLGLIRIDHVGQTMDYGGDADLAAVLHLDLQNDEDADGRCHRSRRHRPQSGRRRIWTSASALTLNGAENRRTLAGHFIAETFGSGVQHLAFATDDIFATATRLQSQRLRTSPDLPELLR